DPFAAVGARFCPVAGNHDFPVQPHWFEFWAPPADKLYYSFDYGNSHFIVLDTNKAILSEGDKTEDQKCEPGSEHEAIQTQAASYRPGSAQYEWLAKDLATTKKAQVFVFFHSPAFSYSGHDGDPGIQRWLCPLFEQYKVTAVFSGHSHSYERFVPLRVDVSSGKPVAVPDEKNGVVYIVTAGGGMPLYDITPNPTHAATAKAFHFIRVDVDGEIVKCTVIEAKTGKVLDSFELKSRRQ
ncbi:MAG: metallophosphoesterase, partial [Thermoleophilia bacterium]|nr:metallophosphoesterase [Thermoleophilia bacterium]